MIFSEASAGKAGRLRCARPALRPGLQSVLSLFFARSDLWLLFSVSIVSFSYRRPQTGAASDHSADISSSACPAF
jgi:hypothetical protein